ncbi:MAG: enoyl-CoA hydratase/isomerase family protein [Candidatus Limnocylindrales bacterium]
MTFASSGAAGLRVEQGEGVAWLIIDRPHRRNAIDRATRLALAAAAAAAEADPEVRVVVLTGSGSSFCAGTDLKEAPPDPPPNPLADPLPRISGPIEALSKPVIAAINGPAAGGGLELALAADLRIASTNATFALPEVRVGSLAGSGGTQRLLAAIPPAVAWKMLLTGEPIAAAEALRVGLVSDVVEPGDLRALAASLAATIVANAPLSVRAAKVAGQMATGQGLENGLAFERALWALLSTTDDRAEGRAAFREGRAPRFRGR